MNAQAQEIEQAFDEQRATAAVAVGQCVGTQQQHRANHLARQWRTYANGVAYQQVALQEPRIGRRDPLAGKIAEAGRDAVDDLVRGDDLLDHCPAGRHARPRVGSQPQIALAVGYSFDLIKRQVEPVELDHGLSPK